MRLPCCGFAPSADEAEAEEPEVVFARAKLAKTCIAALLVDSVDQSVFYAGAWDGSVRRYELAPGGASGALTRVYDGCGAAVEALAQCRCVALGSADAGGSDGVGAGADVLFAVPAGAPGVCCWLKATGELVAVFSLGTGGFAGSAVHASADALFCGHVTAGVVRWQLNDDALGARRAGARAHVRDAHVLELGGSFETARGLVRVLSSAHVGAMAAWPAPDAPGRTRRLVTGHTAPLAEMATSSSALAASSLLAMPTYACIIWDAIGAHVLAILPYKHRAPIRAVAWLGDDSVLSADGHGLAVEWSVADAAPVRMFASEQSSCRAFALALDRPWPPGAPRAAAHRADILFTGADRGPALVAHRLAGGDARSPTTAAVPAQAHGARRLALPAGARDSLYSLAISAGAAAGNAGDAGHAGARSYRACRAPQRWFVTGHLSGEIFVWTDTALLCRLAPPSPRFVGVRQALGISGRALSDGPGSPRFAAALAARAAAAVGLGSTAQLIGAQSRTSDSAPCAIGSAEGSQPGSSLLSSDLGSGLTLAVPGGRAGVSGGARLEA
ncbi:hypothetical protein KFE25_002238 [Diacronema lutheri]|uniref:Uncharacterized protein n=1 Tax=Diacronema lutheri TaxID=2081491 RepID=A0A8J5XLX6_DIALT|nr:hypothetical protein KFE25_002238 [Diacronema lutheri]